jgi:hypothetical protein
MERLVLVEDCLYQVRSCWDVQKVPARIPLSGPVNNRLIAWPEPVDIYTEDLLRLRTGIAVDLKARFLCALG